MSSENEHARPRAPRDEASRPAVREPSHAERCRTLVAQALSATLCTIAREPSGYPYGSLVTVAVDFCGRPAFVWRVQGLEGKWIGDFDCELVREFFGAFATRAQCNLHVLLHYGGNAHHVTECIFKAFARACDSATRIDPRLGGTVPSTKGTLTG